MHVETNTDITIIAYSITSHTMVLHVYCKGYIIIITFIGLVTHFMRRSSCCVTLIIQHVHVHGEASLVMLIKEFRLFLNRDMPAIKFVLQPAQRIRGDNIYACSKLGRRVSKQFSDAQWATVVFIDTHH